MHHETLLILLAFPSNAYRLYVCMMIERSLGPDPGLIPCRPVCFRLYLTLLWQSDDLYDAVCNGCQASCSCVFEDAPLVPTCSEALEHSTSLGGNVTMEMLSIDRGYWRATPTSTGVLPCYHADACLGGLTGSAGYCLEGHEGPCE